MCKHAFYFTHRRCSDVGVCTSTLFCRTSVCVFDKNTSWGVGCENLHTAQCSRIRQTFWHPTYTCDAISRVRRCIGCANIHMTPCRRIQQTFWHPTYTRDDFCVFDKDTSSVSNRGLLMLVFVQSNLISVFCFARTDINELHERWGAGVETQKNVRGEVGGWGRVPFNEPCAPSLSTSYDGA